MNESGAGQNYSEPIELSNDTVEKNDNNVDIGENVSDSVEMAQPDLQKAIEVDDKLREGARELEREIQEREASLRARQHNLDHLIPFKEQKAANLPNLPVNPPSDEERRTGLRKTIAADEERLAKLKHQLIELQSSFMEDNHLREMNRRNEEFWQGAEQEAIRRLLNLDPNDYRYIIDPLLQFCLTEEGINEIKNVESRLRALNRLVSFYESNPGSLKQMSLQWGLAMEEHFPKGYFRKLR